ncbi:hypothetical protein EPI10_032041 [Gossypium australe]|uniref:Uncharacterized protein n=1 Tax=Gossypium australe TaxID=47621 RepID=A0A5B6X559_9ROSI|nr:hypothetical protein EPI10_032041 [Gossypium australe]
MGDIKERLKEVKKELADGLQSMKKQLKDYVWEPLSSIENKMIKIDDALEAMIATLQEDIGAKG